ncbi:PhoH-like phosphate starvation-inducible [Vibrio phage 11895-B1]|uniref:PhoH-like phosphate starvation-inducible n=1 Tax=Vibrio phage 11895-B1 TaxID=754075 RepID=UPI0002C13A3C|nr:PhoH-like phosphate starvation-inducible [Vibrio phage 11895-B1]AGH32088.1 hypothetical protein VPHG_00021 [Vibrio phage 11895-B1]
MTNEDNLQLTRKKNRKNKQDRHEERMQRGTEQLAADIRKKQFDNDWKLDWFEPLGKQVDIVESILSKDEFDEDGNQISFEKVFCAIQGSSGVGKTTTALHTALTLLRDGSYRQLIFAKNPTEVGDDKIGFLSGSETDKLQAHYDTTKRIFHEFMSPQKLENDIGSGKIRLTIPNFLLGATFDYSIVLIDECQVMSPPTMKLLLERCGVGTKYIIMGDSKQNYSISKRQDGFKDFLSKVLDENDNSKSNLVAFTRLTSDENQRSEGSKFITKLYDEDEILR